MVTTPTDAAPGRPYTGRMKGLSIRFISDTRPNSENSAEMAPMMTHRAVRYSTVSVRRTKAVLIMVLMVLPRPILAANSAKKATNSTMKMKFSGPISFL